MASLALESGQIWIVERRFIIILSIFVGEIESFEGLMFCVTSEYDKGFFLFDVIVELMLTEGHEGISGIRFDFL